MPTSETTLLQNYLLVGALLFGIGLVGFIVRRNVILMFLCAEMMLQGVSLSLVAWGRFHQTWDGQILVIFIIAVAGCEAGIALVLILMLTRRGGDLDIVLWQQLREEGQAAYVDRKLAKEAPQEPRWPTLTPAGIEPKREPEEEMHRSHV